MSEGENARTAERIALHLLGGHELPTGDEIRATVQQVLGMLGGRNQVDGIDEQRLIRQIEAKCSIFVPSAATLEDTADHLEWLGERKGGIEWRFWNRYRMYLEDTERLPRQAVQGLDQVTDEILRRLENPRRPGRWDRRGMVVGQVQSGKTSNYTGLISKAVDAGYRFIVVLAGAHNNLRSQTQSRLDRHFLGFDTQQKMLFDQSNARVGVGLLPHVPFYIAHSLTSSANNGDFHLTVARQANVMIGGADPVLLVVKKNASVLRNLTKWATSVLQQADPSTGKKVVRDVPLLLIDDEADNASINTNLDVDDSGLPDPDLDPSRINGLIRKLLSSFEKTAYVGYTATPFANIFIAEDVVSDEFGGDLFPRSFIINLAPPSNYLGPARVFGLSADREAGIEEAHALPIVREVQDYRTWVPDAHRKDLLPGPLPASLREALQAFVLTCAARLARGAGKAHNSMLIHVTRFVAVQGRVTQQVEDALKDLQLRLKYGEGKSPDPVLDELRALWERDFLPTSAQFPEDEAPRVSWEQVRARLDEVASGIVVRRVNGTSKDALIYDEHPNGLRVICIGGDKLSRGLTLEGLSVSYYLRASRMYDTLMQMGRWFGYRPEYADLCRLYTTGQLVRWYRDIAQADQELRQRFEDMAALDRTPLDYGLAIRNHPDGLMITAPGKMRHGKKVFVSFSAAIIETISFYRDEGINRDNLVAAERLIHHMRDTRGRGAGEREGGTRVWDHIPALAVLEFLGGYTTHEGAHKARADLLRRYISARLAEGELVEWTVALIGNSTRAQVSIAGLDVGPIERRPSIGGGPGDSGTYVIRRLVSPTDEYLDLTRAEKERALLETQDHWRANPGRSKRTEAPEQPNGQVVRRLRPSTRGLLLLYPLDPGPAGLEFEDVPAVLACAISFPHSAHQSAIEYTVNRVYWEEIIGGDL